MQRLHLFALAALSPCALAQTWDQHLAPATPAPGALPLCIGGPLARIGFGGPVQQLPGTTEFEASVVVDLASPSIRSGPLAVLPGVPVYVQYGHRRFLDSPSFTNSLVLTFAP